MDITNDSDAKNGGNVGFIQYNDENRSIVKSKISEFQADFGGTNIFSPL